MLSIAEIGLNHNGDLEHAFRLMDAAKSAGFQSVKFQNFEASQIYVGEGRAGCYSLLGKEIPIEQLHVDLERPREFFAECRKYAEQLGLKYGSSPIGLKSLTELMDLEPAYVKISSYELTNLPFLKVVRDCGAPIILSTGGASIAEIAEAVDVISSRASDFQLMHCVIEYPAKLGDANLACIESMRAIFGVPVGFSNNGFVDEKGDIDSEIIPYYSGLMGASSYEVHVTLDRHGEGPDQGFSIEPEEQKQTILALKRGCAERHLRDGLGHPCLGSSVKRIGSNEEYVRRFAHKRLYYSIDKDAGDKISERDMCALRPGAYQSMGELPKNIGIIDGLRLTRSVRKYDPVVWADFK